MKKKNHTLTFKKANIVELNSKTLLQIIGGQNGNNGDNGNGNDGNGDGGTTETRPTDKGFSGLLCEDND
ncbi:hypothetical protein [Pontimicrobium sp. MEBiC06410]|jgi:hypothetical protein